MMRRRIQMAATTGLLAACAALVALWVRSYRTADELHVPFWPTRSFLIGSKQGRMVIVPHANGGEPWWDAGVRSNGVRDERSFPIGDARQYDAGLGFGLLRRPQYMVGRTFETPAGGTTYISGSVSTMVGEFGFSIPFWFLAMATGGAGIALCRERPLRFGTRGLLIGTTLIAIVLGLVVALDKPPANWKLDEPVPLDDI